MECIPLRVHDLDFERNLVHMPAAKGGKGRSTVFPSSIRKERKNQLEQVKRLHDEDLSLGFGEVFLPRAPGRKMPSFGQGISPAEGLSGSKAEPGSA